MDASACPSSQPAANSACSPSMFGAFCTYGTTMCVCNAQSETTGAWLCFGT